MLEKWHRYYDNLHETGETAVGRRTHIYLELMSAMAKQLGFQNLEQTDIDKFYLPEAHGKQSELNAECQKEWLRVLKNTARIETVQISSSSIPAIVEKPPIGDSIRKFLEQQPPKTNG